jgi:hypothetical protein
VKKVIIYGRPDSHFGGVQLFDRDGNKILEAGSIEQEKREFILEDGERLIGLKSNKGGRDIGTTYRRDLQFIIGRLE